MNSVPLTDALPSWWDQTIYNHSGYSDQSFIPTILINDTVETDGRFLLYTLASQYLSSSTQSSLVTSDNTKTSQEGRSVFWVACGSSTERQILASLKKSGFDVSNMNSARAPTTKTRSGVSNVDRIKVVPVALELASSILDKDPTQNNPLDQKDYLKKLSKRFASWIKSDQNRRETLVILDDVSSLVQIFGSLHTMAFIQMLKRLLKESNGGVLAFRTRLDLSTHNTQLLDFQSSKNKKGQNAMKNAAGNNPHYYYDFCSSSTWLGAGGGNQISLEHEYNSQFTHHKILDQSMLLELAHGIVDVLPLSSGFAREVHGRLVFTERLSGEIGWYTMKSGGNKQQEMTSDKVDFMRASTRRIKPQNNRSNADATIVNYFCGDQGVKVIRLRS